MAYDSLIIGGGPAGLSAALQCQQLGHTALLVTNQAQQNPLARSKRIDNYLGLPGLTGEALLDAFERHVSGCSAVQIVHGRALRVAGYGDRFAVSVGSEVYEGKTVILATGITRGQRCPGEDALLGKGVSYCASCDGMLYRGRSVAVIGLAQDAAAEANMLVRIGCQVTFVASMRPAELDASIAFVEARQMAIQGDSQVTGVVADGVTLPCQGVFILRDTIAPAALLPELALEQGYIKVDETMATSLPGVFACGDCVGPPLQISKAVGQGQIAAHSASVWMGSEQK